MLLSLALLLSRKCSSGSCLTHEKVVGVGYVAAHAKQLHQIMKLPMYVAAYRHWRVHTNDVGLLDQQFPCFVAQFSHLDLGYGTAGS